MKKMMKGGDRGFTLIELVGALAILAILLFLGAAAVVGIFLLLFLAFPRYLGPRKGALVAEGDQVIQELKAMAWAYYQQHNDFSYITLGAVGFQPPRTSCWTFSYVNPAPAVVKILALANRPGRPQCRVLDARDRLLLFLRSDGSSLRLSPSERL